MSLTAVVSAIDAEIARMEQARNLLAGSASEKRGRKPASNKSAKRKRTMSAAARQRIADAQKKRWAKTKRLAALSAIRPPSKTP